MQPLIRSAAVSEGGPTWVLVLGVDAEDVQEAISTGLRNISDGSSAKLGAGPEGAHHLRVIRAKLTACCMGSDTVSM
jgi:hypothetical protein